MNLDPNTLWSRFKAAFKQTANNFPIQILEQSWLTKSNEASYILKFFFQRLLHYLI